MTNIECLHAAIDTLYVAFKGTLQTETLQTIEMLKRDAEMSQQSQPFMSNSTHFIVLTRGKQGGYAYCLDSGELGAVYNFKAKNKTDDWNIFVEPESSNAGVPRLARHHRTHLSGFGCS